MLWSPKRPLALGSISWGIEKQMFIDLKLKHIDKAMFFYIHAALVSEKKSRCKVSWIPYHARAFLFDDGSRKSSKRDMLFVG